MHFKTAELVGNGAIMLIERLQVQGLLSFGPEGIDLPLEPLNVLIGPNGSGKSNLLQVLGLLRNTAPGDSSSLFNRRNWDHLLWQGPPHIKNDALAKATVVATVKMPEAAGSQVYSLELFLSGQQYRESIRPASASNVPEAWDENRRLSFLHQLYAKIRLYNNWTFGAGAPIRDGQGPPAEPLLPDDRENPGSKPISGAAIREKRDLYDVIGSWPHEDRAWVTENVDNLPGVISRFPRDRQEEMSRYLSRFYDGAIGVRAEYRHGKALLVVEETGGRQIPAERLSDGTLRYLSLLTVLLDPEPPPLIGIEEPELGLHPDIVFELAKLLVGASERTQLVVTTHSHTLVEALTDHPTSVVACNKHQGQTWFKRVRADALKDWMDEQSLGELWASGGIGGNRW